MEKSILQQRLGTGPARDPQRGDQRGQVKTRNVRLFTGSSKAYPRPPPSAARHSEVSIIVASQFRQQVPLRRDAGQKQFKSACNPIAAA